VAGTALRRGVAAPPFSSDITGASLKVAVDDASVPPAPFTGCSQVDPRN